MATAKFLLARTDAGEVWAEAGRETVVLWRSDLSRSRQGEEAERLCEISKEALRRLLAWAEPGWVTVSFSGQLAREVLDSAGQLGLNPENFAIEAINAFLQAGHTHPF